MNARLSPKSPIRTCIISGRSLPQSQLIRLVASEAGEILPDISGKLPGRGVWVTADRAIVSQATTTKHGTKRLGQALGGDIPPNLMARIETMLVTRCQQILGIGRRGGLVIGGGGAIKAAKNSPSIDWLIIASDASPREASAMRASTRPQHQCVALHSSEIGPVFGRESLVFAASFVSSSRYSQSLAKELRRLDGMRQSC